MVSVWLLCCILVSNSYPVRDILPSDGAQRVEIFKREDGAGKGGSKSGASSGPKGGTVGSNGKSSGANAKPAGASSKSTQSKVSTSQGSPGPSNPSASGPPKSSSNSGGPAAPAKSKEADKGPKKASAPSDAKASDAAKDSERQKNKQQGSSGLTAPQAGSLSSQQQQQAGMSQKPSDSVQSQSREADRGVTGQTDTANTPQRGAVSGAQQGGPVDGASRAAQQQQGASDQSVSQQSTTQQGVGQQPVGQSGAPQAPPAGNPTPQGSSQPQGVNGATDAQGASASLPGNAQQAAAAAPQAPAVSAPQPGTQPAAAVEGAPPAVAQQSVPAGQDVATTGPAPAADSGAPPAVSSDSATQGAAEENDVTKMNHFSTLPKADVMTLQNVEAIASENGKNMPDTAEQQKLAAQAPPDTVKVEYGRMRLSQDTLKSLGYSQDQMNQMNSDTAEGYKLSKDAAAYALKSFGTDSFVAQQMGPQTFTNFKQGTMTPQEQQKFADLKAQYTNDIAPRPPSVERIVAPPSIVNQRNAETQAPQPAVGSQNFFQNANPAIKSMADNAFQMNQAGPQQAPGAAPPGQPAAGTQPSAMPAQVGPQRLNSDMLKDLGYSQPEMDKMNEKTPAGQALSNSATAHAISEFGVNGFVAAQLGPEFTKRMTNNQMTGEDRKAFNDMKAQLTQGVDMSQYQGRP
ncbi:hypothetical protein MIR68_002247 [Amoeboaphelidium protococcarum]|nr:hypothetical protein MIR68_002247 [Amoeboaphelidium protococcarum]